MTQRDDRRRAYASTAPDPLHAPYRLPKPDQTPERLARMLIKSAALGYAHRCSVLCTRVQRSDMITLNLVVDLRPSTYLGAAARQTRDGLLDVFADPLRWAGRYAGWFRPFLRFEDRVLTTHPHAPVWVTASAHRALCEIVDREAIRLLDLVAPQSIEHVTQPAPLDGLAAFGVRSM